MKANIIFLLSSLTQLGLMATVLILAYYNHYDKATFFLLLASLHTPLYIKANSEDSTHIN